MSNIFRAATVLILIGLLGACAQGARPSAMIAPVQSAKTLPDSSTLKSRMSVGTISGGEETNPIWTSEVSDENFRSALEKSLQLHTILAEGTGPLIVDANLIALNQPLLGISMTVTSSVDYNVKNTAGSTVFNETITTPYTANFSDAYYGPTRLRLANEGAIQANIASFIEKLIAAANADPAKFN